MQGPTQSAVRKQEPHSDGPGSGNDDESGDETELNQVSRLSSWAGGLVACMHLGLSAHGQAASACPVQDHAGTHVPAPALRSMNVLLAIDPPLPAAR